MREALRRHLDQLAIQEFDPLVLMQDSGSQHQPQVFGREAARKRRVELIWPGAEWHAIRG